MTRNYLLVLAASLSLATACAGKGSGGAAGPNGPVGAIEVVPNAPSVASLAPEFASPAMQVTITGTDFGTSPEVLVGGAPANIVSATGTSIVFNPPAFAAVDQNGFAPVVVHVNGLESNPFPFRPGQAGDFNGPNVIQVQPSRGDIVVLGSGKLLVNQGRLYAGYGGLPITIDPATGKITSNLSYGSGGLSQPIAMRQLDATNVLLLDNQTRKLMKYNTTTGAVTVFHSLEANYSVSDFVIDGTNIFVSWGYAYIEKIDTVAGTDNPYFANTASANCVYSGSIDAIGGKLYVSTYFYYAQYYGYAKACSIDEGTGGVTAMSFTGTTPDFVSEIRNDGTDLTFTASVGGVPKILKGVVTGTTAATTVETVAIPGSAYGYAGSLLPLGAGEYLVSTNAAVYQINATTLTLQGASPVNATSPGVLAHSNGKIYVASNPDSYGGTPAMVTEIDPVTGTFRLIAARTNFTDTYGAIDADATSLYVSGGVAGVFGIDQITIANNTVTPIVTGLGPFTSFARDAAGSFYIADGSTNVVQYDGQGAVANATYATLPNGGATSVVRHGTSLYFVAGTEIDTVTVAAGGPATAVAMPSLVNAQLVSFDAAGTMLVIDNGTLYTVTAEGFLKPWLVQYFSDPRSLTVQPDGTLLVADANYGFANLLP